MRSLAGHRMRLLFLVVGVPLLIGVAACIQNFRRVDAEQVTASRSDSVQVPTPVKAHLLDGSTVVFGGGAFVVRDSVRGTGVGYDIRLASTGTRSWTIPLDSVLAMETFRQATNVGTSVLTTLLASAATFAVASVLAVAIFGSCPTIYSVPDTGGTPVLEAEAFSASIAPLLEGRDVDRLTLRPNALGRVRLEVRNEALETHYINHLELLAVRHGAGEMVLPDGRGIPVAVRGIIAPSVATDRVGRDLRPVFEAMDDRLFASDPGSIATALEGDLEERLELAVPAPKADSAALVLTMRSSLLNTVLMYDFMLGRPGAKSLDWLATGIEEISTAIQLGRWMNERTGMRVSVWDGTAWRRVVRLPDYGPIAWRHVAVVVPVPPGIDTLRVRLAFAPDGWRIDEAKFAMQLRRPAVRSMPLARMADRDGAPHATGLAAITSPDSSYLETRPGTMFTIEFDAGPTPADSSVTLLLASQGYYTEWVRGSWIKNATGEPFQPTDATLDQAVRRWLVVKDSMETQFHSSRIPVR
ncbi:MAG: hypothetical protein ACR2HZ_04145 [Gemmatimonadaceae bacterium]